MKTWYADLHIHIGRTLTGKAVKITGSRNLTLPRIIEHARNEKGLDMVGIIDCHAPEVLKELEELEAQGELEAHPDGGLMSGGLCIIPGSELEINGEDTSGPIHVLCFFPDIRTMKEFSVWMSGYMKNINLSSQRIYVDGKELQRKTKELGGLFIPAHVFTPFKSLYGKGVESTLAEVFDPELIDAVELGLSSDTEMADQIEELHKYPFLTNSDAHSLSKIAREYQEIRMDELSFRGLEAALKGKGNSGIAANYGLDPLLGKYHRTVCSHCFTPVERMDLPCGSCGSLRVVKGVSDRIAELGSNKANPSIRPLYIHHVPLEFIPGIGPRLLDRLLDHFGNEMAILHKVPEEALAKVVPAGIADKIIKSRNGRLAVNPGGGGKYGRSI